VYFRFLTILLKRLKNIVYLPGIEHGLLGDPDQLIFPVLCEQKAAGKYETHKLSSKISLFYKHFSPSGNYVVSLHSP